MTKTLSLAEIAGKNLKNYIKTSQYKTQERFANEGIYVDPVTVRRWIAHGIKDINLIKQIADVLGVTFLELLK